MLEISDIFGELYKNMDILVTCCHPGWCQTPGLKPLLEQHTNYKDVKFRSAVYGAYGMAYLLTE